jgi:hypothetical protein
MSANGIALVVAVLGIALLLAWAVCVAESARLDHDPFGDDENEHGRWDS